MLHLQFLTTPAAVLDPCFRKQNSACGRTAPSPDRTVRPAD